MFYLVKLHSFNITISTAKINTAVLKKVIPLSINDDNATPAATPHKKNENLSFMVIDF